MWWFLSLFCSIFVKSIMNTYDIACHSHFWTGSDSMENKWFQQNTEPDMRATECLVNIHLKYSTSAHELRFYDQGEQ